MTIISLKLTCTELYSPTAYQTVKQPDISKKNHLDGSHRVITSFLTLEVLPGVGLLMPLSAPQIQTSANFSDGHDSYWMRLFIKAKLSQFGVLAPL
jgi:hypothetical protein